MLGIVTGASRGLGLALTRALSERGWRLAVDARGTEALGHAVAGLAGVVAIAGDVADPSTAACSWSQRARRSTSSSTTPACSARARSHLWRDTRSRSCEGCTRRTFRAARTHSAHAAGFSRHARIVNLISDAASRPTRLGRVRLLEGRSRAAQRGPRGRASRPACLCRRPRRHAHADAPGRLSRRGHLGSAHARGNCSRPVGAHRR